MFAEAPPQYLLLSFECVMLASLVSALRHTFHACVDISRASFISFSLGDIATRIDAMGVEIGRVWQVRWWEQWVESPQWGIGEVEVRHRGLDSAKASGNYQRFG